MQLLAGQSFGDRLGDSFQETMDGIGGFIPSLIGAILIFVIGWFIAKLIFRVVATVLRKANIDRLVDKSGLGGHLERAGFADSGVFLAKIIYWLIMLIVIKMTVETLGITALQELVDDLVAWMPKLFVALILIFVTGAIANFVKGAIGGATASQSWGNLATTVATAGVWFIGGMAALDQVQIAGDIVDTLFNTVMASLLGILVIKYGVGGIWAARDRFWPSVYNKVGNVTEDTTS